VLRKGHILAITVIVASFITIPVYAENLTVKLWFITSNENGCSIWNEQALDFYQTVTVQYMPMYDLHGYLEEAKCVRLIDVAENYDEFVEARQSVDLPIIVLDHTEATSQLKIQQNEYGHYHFVDDERFGIVFGAFAAYSIEDKKSAWTLSHEISHFALHHKGTPYSVYADWVHGIQTEYDSCNEKSQCTELWTTVISTSGQLIPVMTTYKEIESSEQPYVSTTTPDKGNEVIFAFPEGKLVVKQTNTVSIKGFALIGDFEDNALPYAKLSLKKHPEGTTISTTTADVNGHFIFDLTGSKNSATYDPNSGTSTWDMFVEFAGDSKNNHAKSQIIRLTVESEIIQSPTIEKNIPKHDDSKLVLPQWIRNNR